MNKAASPKRRPAWYGSLKAFLLTFGTNLLLHGEFTDTLTRFFRNLLGESTGPFAVTALPFLLLLLAKFLVDWLHPPRRRTRRRPIPWNMVGGVIIFTVTAVVLIAPLMMGISVPDRIVAALITLATWTSNKVCNGPARPKRSKRLAPRRLTAWHKISGAAFGTAAVLAVGALLVPLQATGADDAETSVEDLSGGEQNRAASLPNCDVAFDNAGHCRDPCRLQCQTKEIAKDSNGTKTR